MSGHSRVIAIDSTFGTNGPKIYYHNILTLHCNIFMFAGNVVDIHRHERGIP